MNRYLRHIFLLSVCCVLFISSIHAQLVFQDKATKKWGYKNQEGEIVCPAEYSEIKIISKEFVFAGKTGAHFGLIDQKTGRELTPLIYGGMEMFDDDKVIAFVYKPGDVLHSYCVVLNKKGKEISSHYWIIGKCIDGFAVVGLENEKDEQHFGFINSKCKVTMPIVYELVFPYSDDMARVLPDLVIIRNMAM